MTVKAEERAAVHNSGPIENCLEYQTASLLGPTRDQMDALQQAAKHRRVDLSSEVLFERQYRAYLAIAR